MVTSRMHMTRGMIRRKRNIPVVNYIQKNVCSIMSVNCLLDLISLPYFENIFCMFSVACLAKKEQMRFSLDVNFSRNFVVNCFCLRLDFVLSVPLSLEYTNSFESRFRSHIVTWPQIDLCFLRKFKQGSFWWDELRLSNHNAFRYFVGSPIASALPLLDPS